MTAQNASRRSQTAAAAAAVRGVSERQIRNIKAEPRREFESRYRTRGEQILAWRQERLLWREIADRLGISINAAQVAGLRARRRRDAEAKAARDAESLPPPLFS